MAGRPRPAAGSAAAGTTAAGSTAAASAAASGESGGTTAAFGARVAEARARVEAMGLGPLAWEVLDARGSAASLDGAARPPMDDGAWPPFAARRGGLTDRGLAVLGACAPRLRSLSLRHCVDVTAAPGERGAISSAGLAELVRGPCGRRLTSLDLGGCPWADDLALGALGRCCPSLLLLNLAACTAVSDAGLASLVRPTGCVDRLEALSLVRCAGVTSAGVRRVLASCGAMRSVVVTRSGCSPEDVASMAAAFPSAQFHMRDPGSYVDASASQLVPGFRAPPPGESFDSRIRNKLGIRVAAKGKKTKGKKGAKRR